MVPRLFLYFNTLGKARVGFLLWLKTVQCWLIETLFKFVWFEKNLEIVGREIGVCSFHLLKRGIKFRISIVTDLTA